MEMSSRPWWFQKHEDDLDDYPDGYEPLAVFGYRHLIKLPDGSHKFVYQKTEEN